MNSIAFDIDINGVSYVNISESDAIANGATDEAIHIALKKAKKIQEKTTIRKKIDQQVGDDKTQIGKIANFASALANINLTIFANLATAKSFSDVRKAIKPYNGLILQLRAKIDAGEIMSVHRAQGKSDADAIFEGLEALTKIAFVFKEAQEQQEK